MIIRQILGREIRVRHARPGGRGRRCIAKKRRVNADEVRGWRRRKREKNRRRAGRVPSRSVAFLAHDSPEYDIMRVVLKPHERETTCLPDVRLRQSLASHGTTGEPHDRHVSGVIVGEREREKENPHTIHAPRYTRPAAGLTLFHRRHVVSRPRISDAPYHNAGCDLISSVNRESLYVKTLLKKKLD